MCNNLYYLFVSNCRTAAAKSVIQTMLNWTLWCFPSMHHVVPVDQLTCSTHFFFSLMMNFAHKKLPVPFIGLPLIEFLNKSEKCVQGIETVTTCCYFLWWWETEWKWEAEGERVERRQENGALSLMNRNYRSSNSFIYSVSLEQNEEGLFVNDVRVGRFGGLS